MLEVHRVTKNFRQFTALEGIDLQFDRGIYGLLAPNGAGKTTLIKMLVTLIFPTKGEITYNGENIIDLDEKYRDILGYLPQEFGYYKNYSPEKYLIYLASLKGLTKSEAKEKIPELLALVGLKDVANKKMKKFSGGMIQRVGICQALLNDPQVLILDEPTAGLDPKERARFRKILSNLARERTIILSTHIVSDVESIANEIVMIKNKQVLYKKRQEDLCLLLEGKLFETKIPFEEVEQFRADYSVLAEKQEEGKMMMRFAVEKGDRDQGWTTVSPTLEDVFLYIFEEETDLTGGIV
ncbi:ABC-type multidrug transport system, ATPase component [Halobacillus alkaliphilus]|uniref:ABC-type multidrug transport system, ATPase component n=1 Tax=Halobacillus alkaliphilus TaxID=396056 RepID=A0A1I2N6R6_9BACI|nr:ABC transporter ATP-binding protein [Halobacillus alkaliphilus]SFF97196.1 ABC-type multidrug transport system, ATPase component [Halobacillus alkaliphilus]